MGVLLGGFGKLQMGSYYRSLQKRLMNVQSKLRTAQRQTARVQDMITRQEKSINNQLTLQQYQIRATVQADALVRSGYAQFQGMDLTQLSEEDRKRYSQAQTDYNSIMSQADAQIAMQIANAKTQAENEIQQMKDIQLEACKDEEDYLGQQKDTLESQIQTVKSDYEACKQMEQQDLQMFKPTYTGGGNG